VRLFNAERELVRDVTPPPLNADGFRVGAVNNGSLGVLDLSLVDNGLYDLELTVRAGYRQSSTNVRFALESDLKIGHFSFSEEDLVLPVNGFPLTITRTYNSLNLKKGEFGRSWTYTFSDLQYNARPELNTPTMARVVPRELTWRRDSFSVTNTSRSEVKLTYVRLND
jgi:hypothetical protein